MSNFDWGFFVACLLALGLFMIGVSVGIKHQPNEKQIIEAIHSYQSNAFVNAERLKRIEQALKEGK